MEGNFFHAGELSFFRAIFVSCWAIFSCWGAMLLPKCLFPARGPKFFDSCRRPKNYLCCCFFSSRRAKQFFPAGDKSLFCSLPGEEERGRNTSFFLAGRNFFPLGGKNIFPTWVAKLFFPCWKLFSLLKVFVLCWKDFLPAGGTIFPLLEGQKFSPLWEKRNFLFFVGGKFGFSLLRELFVPWWRAEHFFSCWKAQRVFFLFSVCQTWFFFFWKSETCFFSVSGVSEVVFFRRDQEGVFFTAGGNYFPAGIFLAGGRKCFFLLGGRMFFPAGKRHTFSFLGATQFSFWHNFSL